MRVWIDIGIHTQRDRRAQALFCSYAIDLVQLRFALDIQTEHTVFERVVDFFARFAYASECAFGGGAARGEHTKQLAAGNNVKPGTRIRQ